MSFLFPAMLAALAALAAPVLIHLIARNRFPVQDFPTLRLLQAEQRDNVFSPRLVDKWQLLLRLLVVAAVVLAVSRPALPLPAVGRSAKSMVIVLDCSPSMLAADPGRQDLFEQAREQAANLARSAGPHDHVAYIEAGHEARVVFPLTRDAPAVARRIAEAQVSHSGGRSLAEAVAAACRTLRPRREVLSQAYVLSDMRRNVLDGWGDRQRAALDDVRKRLGERFSLDFVRFAPPKLPNVGIVDATLTPGRISVGSDAHLAATIRNVSDQDRRVQVDLEVRRTRAGRRSITIPADSKAVVHLAAAFDLPGLQAAAPVNTFCKLSLSPSDALGMDDAFYVPIHLDRRFEVLLIDGSRAAPPGGKTGGPAALSGAKMLEFALNPFQFAASEGRGRTRNSLVRRVSLDAANTAMLGTCRLVILYNVSALPQRTMTDLHEFVKGGRSVLIVPGDEEGLDLLAMRSFFTHPKKDGWIRLCPADVQDARPVAPGTAVSLGERVHPVTEAFADLRKGDLGTVHFKRLRRLLPVEGAETIFYVGDRPAAVEMRAAVPGDTPRQRKRRGRICVLGFAMEPAWSNLALTRVFVPLIWRLTDYVADRLDPIPVDMSRCGRRLVVDCSPLAPSPSVALLDPDGEPVADEDGWPLELPLSPEGTAVVGGLSRAGAYRLTAQSQLPVEVRLPGGKSIAGTATCGEVRDAADGKAKTLRVRRPAGGQTVTPAETAEGRFDRAVRVRGVRIALAGGAAAVGDAPIGPLRSALAGRADAITLTTPDGERIVRKADTKGGRFAGALTLPQVAGAIRRSRFITANPVRGETDTTPLDPAAIAARLGEGNWRVLPAADLAAAEPKAREIWYLLAMVLLGAYFAEGLVAHWLSYRRERARAA